MITDNDDPARSPCWPPPTRPPSASRARARRRRLALQTVPLPELVLGVGGLARRKPTSKRRAPARGRNRAWPNRAHGKPRQTTARSLDQGIRRARSAPWGKPDPCQRRNHADPV